jgi:tetratricopeptide (TPR) repeat protein
VATSRGGSPETLKLAEAQLRKAVEINPQCAPAHSYLSYVLMQEGTNLEEAAQHALRAAALEPGSADYVITAGRVMMRLERYEDATKLGRRALAQAVSESEVAQAKRLIEESEAQAEWQKKRGSGEKEPSAEAEATGSGSTADTDESRPVVARQRGNGKPLVFKGRVTDVSCTGMAVTLSVTGNGQTLRLGAPNYAKIEYETFKWEPPPNFTPCRHLMGHTISATYLQIESGPPDGEVTKVQVLE